MARKGMCGFEMGNLASEVNVFAGVTVSLDSTIKRTGANSLKIVAISGSGATTSFASLTLTKKERWYVRVTSLPSIARPIFGTPGVNSSYIALLPSGALEWRFNAGGGQVTAYASTTLLTDSTRWYRVELMNFQNAAISGGDIIGYIDNEVAVSIFSAGAGQVGTGFGQSFGPTDSGASAYTINLDDYAQDDSDWIGDSAIGMSLPVSDNARGGWTGGAGGTTNLFDAVNNVPPVGVAAASETNTSQIKNAVSSTTDNCDFNMQSYTAIGVPQGSTIQQVQAICADGEEIATGTKAGAIKIVSNPTQSVEDAFNFGNDLGADGTYPTNWAPRYLTTQVSPSVVFGTQPVLRVGKRTATTRVVNICFLGLYVEYTQPKSMPIFGAHKVQRYIQKRIR